MHKTAKLVSFMFVQAAGGLLSIDLARWHTWGHQSSHQSGIRELTKDLAHQHLVQYCETNLFVNLLKALWTYACIEHQTPPPLAQGVGPNTPTHFPFLKKKKTAPRGKHSRELVWFDSVTKMYYTKDIKSWLSTSIPLWWSLLYIYIFET